LTSAVISFLKRELFSKTFVFDLTFLFTIIVVLSIDLVMGGLLNLKAPYTDAFKYAYHALPSFCLIAGSLASKSLTLFNAKGLDSRLKKAVCFSLAFAGVFLITSSLVANAYQVNRLSVTEFVQFRVRMDQELGYSLDHVPLSPDNPVMLVQYAGIAVFSFSVLCAVRNELLDSIRNLSKMIRRRT
jgi:hypothetical protein